MLLWTVCTSYAKILLVILCIQSITITDPVQFSMERVKSKHLFNFRPAGVVDSDILEQEKKMYKTIGDVDGEIFSKHESKTDEEFGVFLRRMMDGVMDRLLKSPLFIEVT